MFTTNNVQSRTIDDYFKLIPTVLIVEIFKYLDMGIILSLYGENKKVILNCILDCTKKNKNMLNDYDYKIFSKYTQTKLINIIMNSSELTKKYIMDFYIIYKKSIIILKKTNFLQKQLMENFNVGDYFMDNSKYYENYLIIEKNSKYFNCIKIFVNVNNLGQPAIIYQSSYKIYCKKIKDICFKSDNIVIQKWLHRIEILNSLEYINIKKDYTNLGIFKKKDIPTQILSTINC